MGDEVKAARAYLDGLKKRAPQPWDEPLSAERVANPPRTDSPEPPNAPSGPDDAMDQAQKIADRNRDIAQRTRHLRQN